MVYSQVCHAWLPVVLTSRPSPTKIPTQRRNNPRAHQPANHESVHASSYQTTRQHSNAPICHLNIDHPANCKIANPFTHRSTNTPTQHRTIQAHTHRGARPPTDTPSHIAVKTADPPTRPQHFTTLNDFPSMRRTEHTPKLVQVSAKAPPANSSRLCTANPPNFPEFVDP